MATRTPDILASLGQGGDDALGLAIGPTAERISTVKIRLDGGTQPRAGIDQTVVDDYHADMTNGAQFPPIEVVFDGTDYWLWDGFHRFHAWRKNGDRAILVHVRQGTRRDAVLLSVGANATHGFRRTNEDKRRAVMALLHDEEWRQWSDREIARRCAVDNSFVSKLRAGLSVDGQQIETRRVVRNGTEYTMATPQRTPAPAVAAQDGKWLSLAELTAQLRAWADVWEKPGAALLWLKNESISREGDHWDDWMNWVEGKYSTGMLGAAINTVLAEIEPTAEPEQARHSVAKAKPAPAPEPWIVEELVEELMALEGVALDGVDQDWLYEYMQGIAGRHNRICCGRRDFDVAMRMAIPRQRADNERRERLARAQAAAMAADAERARSETGPSAAGDGETITDRLVLWSETAGGQVALNEMLAEMAVHGFPMVGQFPRWRAFKQWSGDDVMSSMAVRDALRSIASMPKVDDMLPAQPAQRGRELEFERKKMNQGGAVKLYGRNQDGTLTVTVNTETVHLYSPGITMTLEDAYNLTVLMQRAMGQMHLVRTRSS